jgi:hypothetical protein
MIPDRSSAPVVATFLTLIAGGPLVAGEPAPGEVRTRQVVSLALNVGSLEKEAKRVVYAPPPGWYIRSHTVDCRSKFGSASFAVNTVPADWTWDATETASEEAKLRVSGSVKGAGPAAQAAASYRLERTSSEHTRRAASHHALVVEATARGTGLLGSGSGLELTVTAELVFVGEERGP